MIDVEHRQLADAARGQLCERCGGDLVTRLEIDLARLFVDQIRREVPADQIFLGNEHIGKSFLAEPPRDARRHPLARRQHDLAGAGVEQIARQLAFEVFFPERRHPPLLTAPKGDRPVKVGEYLLLRHAGGFTGLQRPALGAAARPQLLGRGIVECEQQSCRRELPPPVDPHVYVVLCVELEIEPGAAIGDYARGKQVFARGMRLALVMVEKDPRAAVHLRDDHPLGAVDDVADRARSGVLVDIPDDEPQRDLERRGKGDAALLAFIDLVFR